MFCVLLFIYNRKLNTRRFLFLQGGQGTHKQAEREAFCVLRCQRLPITCENVPTYLDINLER